MFQHHIFSDTFHCEKLLVLLVLNQIYLTKVTTAYQPDNLEILKLIKWYIFLLIRHHISSINLLTLWHLCIAFTTSISSHTWLSSSHCLLPLFNILNKIILTLVKDASILWFKWLLGHAVFLIKPSNIEWHPIIPPLNIFLCCHIVSEAFWFANTKYFQILFLQSNVGGFSCVHELLPTIVKIIYVSIIEITYYSHVTL